MPGLLTFPPVADVRVPVAGGSALLTHRRPIKKVRLLLFVVQRAVRCRNVDYSVFAGWLAEDNLHLVVSPGILG